MEVRIPQLRGSGTEDMKEWFAELADRGLLFHIEDHPAEVFSTTTGERLFTDEEAASLKTTVDRLFGLHGDRVYETVYPIFMKTAGFA